MSTLHRVLVSDSMSESGLEPLRAADDIQVDIRTNLTEDELLATIGDYDALLVRSSTTVSAQVIQAGKRLRVVGRAGVGVDNIDVDAATQAGVIVANAPTGNVVAAAEHTIALLMTLARNVVQADIHVRAGKWQRNHFIGVEIRNKVLGVVGFGRVAQEVARRGQGLGMSVITYDPYVTPDFAAQRGAKVVELDALLSEADFITVHVPLTPQTTDLIGEKQFKRMKPTTRVLNVARGGVINEDALVAALNNETIAGAALDVFTQEPLPADSPLRTCERLILTPHLGGSTYEAQDQVAEDVALQVVDVLNDRPARYAVNAPIIPPKDLDFLVPYIDLAERMGRFIQQIIPPSGISQIEIAAQGYLAEFDLAFISAAAIKGLLSDVVDIRINLVNAKILAERRGITLSEHRLRQQDARYENMISISVHTGAETWSVRGSVLQDEPYIVGLNDLWVDFPASGNMLLSSHRDRPGIVGHVGMILGQSDINISFMHVGRRGPRTDAIMVLGTDERTPPALLKELSAISHITWFKAVTI
ncbi:MAG: phosphoglycerate dehydrogenase [Litorilinea sp.]